MQEIINIVSSLKKDIEALRVDISNLKKTHTQFLCEEWITKDQAMKILKISPRTLYALTRNGKLPYSKIQGSVYFRTMDIENALKQNYINRCPANSTFNNK